MVRLRRADVLRIQKELENLGGMFLTDFFHAVSHMTASEVHAMAAKAGYRQLHEWQAREDAGEAPRVRPEEVRIDAEEDRINELNTAPEGDKETDQ